MRGIALVFFLFPIVVMAAEPTPTSPAPEMVLLPRALAEAATQWIAQPNASNAVQLYAALTACISDNPQNGVVMRSGVDQCQIVTQALAARSGMQPPAKVAAKPSLPEAR